VSKNNRICYTCGQEYYYCPSCPSKGKVEAFYNMFHEERCSKIFKLLTDETCKHITTAECKQALLDLNVSINEKYKQGVKQHIEKVMNYEDSNQEIIENDVFVDEIVNTDNAKETSELLKINYVSKKRRKHKNSEVDY